MIGQFLLAFRETLESALIISIILAYLGRTKRNASKKYVWYGIYFATGASFVIGAFLWFLYGSLPGHTKALFEGVAAFIAVPVLTSMIYWMTTKSREIKAEVERHLTSITTHSTIIGLLGFSFIVVFREGLETVLFLTPFLVVDVTGTLIGAFLGVIISLVLAYVIFIFGMKINIRKFFYITSMLLVLLAAGLAGYGVHEILEYSENVGIETGWLGENAYALNISEDSPLHHKGIIGSIFAVMFGYTVKAEWLRVIVHIVYLIIFLPLVVWVYKKPYSSNS